MQDIEAAAQGMYSSDIQVQQESINFLGEWKMSEESPEQAIYILANSEVVVAKTAAAIVLLDHVKARYGSMAPEVRTGIRETVIGLLRQHMDVRIVSQKLNEIIVFIALFDWPQNWPNFPFDIYPPDTASEGNGSVFVFDDLVVQVMNSPVIDSSRRQFLISAINHVIPQIFAVAVPALHDSDKILCSISLHRNLTKIAPIELLITENVIAMITAAFQAFDDVHIPALELATDLLIDRVDAVQCFEMFGLKILHAKSLIPYPSPTLASFFLHYLCKYLPLYEQIPDVNVHRALLNELVMSFTWKLDYDTSVLWKLWYTIANRVTEGCETTIALMGDMWPSVLRSYTGYFSFEGCRKNRKCCDAWRTIVSLIPRAVTEYFLGFTRLTMVLDYAIAATMKYLPVEMRYSLIERFFDITLEAIRVTEMNPENASFKVSLFYLAAAFIEEMDPVPEHIETVITAGMDLLSTGIDGIENIVAELLETNGVLVHYDNWKFTRCIIENLEQLLTTTKGYPIFKALNTLDIEDGRPICAPIFKMLEIFCCQTRSGNVNLEFVNFALKCCTHANERVLEHLWPAFLETAKILTAPELNGVGSDTHDLFLMVLADGFEKAPLAPISEIIKEIITLYGNNPTLVEHLCTLIASVRRAYPEAESLWPIVSGLVQTQSEHQVTSPASLFEMLTPFENCGEFFGSSVFMSLMVTSIQSLDYRLCSAALSLLEAMVSRMNREQAECFVGNSRQIVIVIIFDALTDMLHAAATRDLSNMLYVLTHVFIQDKSFEEEFIRGVAESVPGADAGPAETLFACYRDQPFEMAYRATCDFLVAAQRITPDGMQKMVVGDEPEDENSDGLDDILIEQIRDLTVGPSTNDRK